MSMVDERRSRLHADRPAKGPRPRSSVPTERSKTVAVVLAVVLAFWTWLYTYRADAAKFWAGLALTVAGIVLCVLYVGLPMLLAVWVWAVVDTASKKRSWYAQYPGTPAP